MVLTSLPRGLLQIWASIPSGLFVKQKRIPRNYSLQVHKSGKLCIENNLSNTVAFRRRMNGQPAENMCILQAENGAAWLVPEGSMP
jgi:hypothetical protein